MNDNPRVLGNRYEVGDLLGRGGMAEVHLGRDTRLGRVVAIKLLRVDLARDPIFQARFRREAQSAASLNHPAIVAVYDTGEEQLVDAAGSLIALPYIVMEYVEGRTLRELLRDGRPLDLGQALELTSGVLSALEYSHRAGIVHRDIKPANVFLLKDGRVKVGDFGIARLESSNLTQAGSVLGTPAYMSPEQFMGQTIDGRSDLFSAGVILYQFLTGEKPFTGQLTTIMHKVLKEEPIAPSELNVQVPPGFDSLMKKALAKRPDERFQTAQAFIAALQATATGGAQVDSDATLIGAGGDAEATLMPGSPEATRVKPAPAAKPVAVDYTPAASVPPPAPTAKKSPALALAIVGGIAAVGLGAGAWMLLGKSGSSAPTDVATTPAAATTTTATKAAPANDKEMVITAVGYADPSDPRYASDPGLLKAELREDAKRQLVEKARQPGIVP